MPRRAETYNEKRSFDETPEPPAATTGNVDPTTARPGSTFMIHQHHARRLHFDLRLEMMNGDTPVLVSWAVPKNLPTAKGRPHLAVHVEDHPFEYGSFEGTIPEGNYGAGEVRIFDSGTYEVLEREPAKLTIRLAGRRLRGVYHLIQTKPESNEKDWLAFLRTDERAAPDPMPQPAPMLSTHSPDPFDDDEWIFEPKWDGVRTIAICSDDTRLLSRNQNDVTATYPELAKLHEQLVALDAMVDGEVVAFENARPSFERLQGRFNLSNERDIARARKTCPVTFIAFDLMYLDGRSLLSEPLEERKRLLGELVVPNQYIQVSTYVEGAGVALSDAIRQQDMEGIVAKKLGCPYRPGKRTKDWLKIKVVHDGDVVIGGWSKGEGNRSRSFGSLLVGAYDGDDLRFVGSVGTGFSQRVLDRVLERLHEVETDECPFVEGAAGLRTGRFGKPIRDPRWTKPVLVAAVEFRELTSGIRLRAPSFKGLRDDKAPEACTLAELDPAAG